MGCGPRQHVLTVGSSTNGVVRSKLIKFVITCATVTLGQYITKRYSIGKTHLTSYITLHITLIQAYVRF